MCSIIPPSENLEAASSTTGGAIQINSSIPKQAQARALKRRNGYYVRPRTPQSPTLQIKWVKQAKGKRSMSGGLNSNQIRLKNYARIPVTELEVETFQTSTAKNEQSASLSSWSPSFPQVLVGPRRMNTYLAPSFNPADNHVSEFSQLRALDLLPALGLAEDDFWKLFSRCKVCHNFMTTMTTPYHVCPSVRDSKSKVGVDIVQTTSFPMRLLDAYDAGREGGLPEDVFKAIFYTCEQCGRYMTERVSLYHHQADDWWDSDDPVDDKKCVYLKGSKA